LEGYDGRLTDGVKKTRLNMRSAYHTLHTFFIANFTTISTICSPLPPLTNNPDQTLSAPRHHLCTSRTRLNVYRRSHLFLEHSWKKEQSLLGDGVRGEEMDLRDTWLGENMLGLEE